MEILVVVISWLLFGGAASYFASQRGRDPFAWFFIGMLLGILGLLLLFLLPPVAVQEEVLEKPPEQALQTLEPTSFECRDKVWFYLNSAREQVGPASFSILQKAFQDKELDEKTLVWSDGMAEWKKIEELKELKGALR